MPLPGLELHDGARFIVLMAALALDAMMGDFGLLFRLVPHPVALLGRLIARLEARLNRPERAPRTRLERGILVVALLVLASALLGWGLERLFATLRFGAAAEVAVVALLLAQRSLFDHVRAVARALSAGGVEEGRRAVAHIVGRDPESLDRHGVARAAIESLAENFGDGVVGPAFWYLLFGLPGIMVHKCVSTLDSMIGHLSERYRKFGAAAAYADTALNFVPARLAAALLALAALFVPGGQPLRAARIALRDASRHRSVNAGWPEAAMAGAIAVALAGPRRYGGKAVPDSWLGEEFTARATTTDIHRALGIYAIACMILFALTALGLGLALGF